MTVPGLEPGSPIFVSGSVSLRDGLFVVRFCVEHKCTEEMPLVHAKRRLFFDIF